MAAQRVETRADRPAATAVVDVRLAPLAPRAGTQDTRRPGVPSLRLPGQHQVAAPQENHKSHRNCDVGRGLEVSTADSRRRPTEEAGAKSSGMAR